MSYIPPKQRPAAPADDKLQVAYMEIWADPVDSTRVLIRDRRFGEMGQFKSEDFARVVQDFFWKKH